MLDQPEYAFFEIRTQEDLGPSEAIEKPLLFRLWVTRYAHSKGRWRKVGDAPVADALCEPVQRFNQDPITKRIRLTINGTDGPEGTIADCKGLECAAVWDPDHVEERLRDFFLGVPNKWEVRLRPKMAG